MTSSSPRRRYLTRPRLCIERSSSWRVKIGTGRLDRRRRTQGDGAPPAGGVRCARGRSQSPTYGEASRFVTSACREPGIERRRWDVLESVSKSGSRSHRQVGPATRDQTGRRVEDGEIDLCSSASRSRKSSSIATTSRARASGVGFVHDEDDGKARPGLSQDEAGMGKGASPHRDQQDAGAMSAALDLSPSPWAGRATMLIFTPPWRTALSCEMVIPFSRSRSRKSITARPRMVCRNAHDCHSIRRQGRLPWRRRPIAMFRSPPARHRPAPGNRSVGNGSEAAAVAALRFVTGGAGMASGAAWARRSRSPSRSMATRSTARGDEWEHHSKPGGRDRVDQAKGFHRLRHGRHRVAQRGAILAARLRDGGTSSAKGCRDDAPDGAARQSVTLQNEGKPAIDYASSGAGPMVIFATPDTSEAGPQPVRRAVRHGGHTRCSHPDEMVGKVRRARSGDSSSRTPDTSQARDAKSSAVNHSTAPTSTRTWGGQKNPSGSGPLFTMTYTIYRPESRGQRRHHRRHRRDGDPYEIHWDPRYSGQHIAQGSRDPVMSCSRTA